MVLFAIAVAFDLLGDWRGIAHVVQGGLFNPDSYMRLERIEAGLRRGHIGYWIPRGGFVLHWSHLFDSLLLAASAPLEPLLGWHRALFWVGAASGPVSVGLLAVAVAWAGAPLSERRFRWWAAVAVGMAPAIEGYGRLGVIHHHVLLVLVAVMVAGYAFRAAAGELRCGMAAGAWFAFGLWVSPEIWPFGILALGALGVGWLEGVPGTGRALAVAGLTASVLVGAILLVDPPPGAVLAFDHVSVVHLGLALAVAGIGAGLAWIDRVGPAAGRRAALGIAVGASLLGAWVAIFPRAVAGPAGMSTAPGAGLMLAAISEMQPVVRPALVVTFLLGGFFGVAGAGWIGWRRRSWLAAYGAGCGVVVLALGFRYVRFSPYGEALGAAMLPPVLTAMGGEMPWRVGLLAVLLLVPRVAPAFDRAPEGIAGGAGCALEGVAARLAPDAGRVVLASADLTPELLYRTRVRVVGGLYVRDVAGFLRLRAAWRAASASGRPAAREPEAVRASGASLVLFCRRAGGARGLSPDWLRLLWYDRASGFALYRIGEK